MSDKKGHEEMKDSRDQAEIDVERMISEGLAGGTVKPSNNRVQIEEARDLPDQDEPFPSGEETRKEK
ncbi:hypothetical protein EDD68_10655 [Melghiribacillus thermohalophilus]|uniref:Uncharacterized protein n=1 Tax=Melghiribacillus thermohalophilus TaxID=1324956 RepID=A0A4R3N3W0_9BACI|nr:hypothetical protein [Melghiribacillus thermohalophilus]TCT23645.1 hypothetical protein EDD68_10655 [Melghiribacillus thermohalophilus]